MGLLGVGIGRQDQITIAIPLHKRGAKKPVEGVDKVLGRSPDKEAQVEGDLVVPAPGGMDLETGRSGMVDEALFHMHVNVFPVGTKLHRSGGKFLLHPVETLEDLPKLLRRQKPHSGQHPGMGPGPPDILTKETAIEGNGFRESFDLLIGRLGEPASPGFVRESLLRILTQGAVPSWSE